MIQNGIGKEDTKAVDNQDQQDHGPKPGLEFRPAGFKQFKAVRLKGDLSPEFGQRRPCALRQPRAPYVKP